jgi:cysteine-rich repeat protein
MPGMTTRGLALAIVSLWLFKIYLLDAACMDVIKEASEQCDDGNAYNSDGCSIDCLLEDEVGQ